MNDRLVRIIEVKAEDGTLEELCNDRDFEIEHALEDHLGDIADGIIESFFDNIFYECLDRVIRSFPIEDDIIDYSRCLIEEKLETLIEKRIRELMEE